MLKSSTIKQDSKLQNQLDNIISNALHAEPLIANTPAYKRANWLEDTADLLIENEQTLAITIVEEGVKTIREARSEVNRAHTTLKLCAEQAKRIVGESIPFDQAANGVGRTGWTEMRPVGLVAAITPFNDPLNLVAHKVGPAIAAGCPVIVKPHECTPGPAQQLLELFTRIGLPEGIFQVLQGKGPQVGKQLVEHPAVKMITFTGGKTTGTSVAISAAGRPVALELGGICATIVLHDADLKKAAQRITSGMFAAAGQNCLHVQRVLVDASVYDVFVQDLIDRTKATTTGDPKSESTDMGELISEESAQRCAAILNDALQRGGKLLVGGNYSGKSFQPTVLSDVPNNARIYSEEVFGPITVIEKFNGLTEAVQRLSTTEPSLAVAVFTQSITAPFSLRQIRAGSIIINDSTDFRIDAMPFGGPFPAGLGREGVQHAIDSMLESQMICLNLN